MTIALIILAALCMWLITQNRALLFINEKQRQQLEHYDRLAGWYNIERDEQ
jgi:hypothetical protein